MPLVKVSIMPPVYQLLDRRPQIIINEIGLFDRTTYKNIINWEVIQDTYLVEIHRQQIICLVVDQHFEPFRSKGMLAQKISKLSKSIGCQELNISLGSVTVNAEKLTDPILLMRSAEKPDRETMMKAALPNTGL